MRITVRETMIVVASVAVLLGFLAWVDRERRERLHSRWGQADLMERHCLAKIRQAQRAANTDESERSRVVQFFKDQAKEYAGRKLDLALG
jgi:hypothetical protein